MDAVLLFSGQGAQKVGMGKDLYDQYSVAKALIEQADKALGESLSAVMFEGPGEELTRTCNCQPALYVHGLACLAVLKELVPSLNPVAAAGLSLGEFTAHAAAGTYYFEEGLLLVQKSGAWFNYGDIRLGQGRDNAKQFLKDNPEIANDIEGQIRANADKLYATRRPAGKAAAAAAEKEEGGETASASKEPVVKAPARSSESELDIMVED